MNALREHGPERVNLFLLPLLSRRGAALREHGEGKSPFAAALPSRGRAEATRSGEGNAILLLLLPLLLLHYTFYLLIIYISV